MYSFTFFHFPRNVTEQQKGLIIREPFQVVQCRVLADKYQFLLLAQLTKENNFKEQCCEHCAASSHYWVSHKKHKKQWLKNQNWFSRRQVNEERHECLQKWLHAFQKMSNCKQQDKEVHWSVEMIDYSLSTWHCTLVRL